jgi:eukaryotic-like serine/threonine-protein kinase
MRYNREQLAKFLLEIYGEDKDKSLFKINVIGRPDQRGNLENKLNADLTPEERSFTGSVLRDLEQQGLILPTYTDIISPTELLKITDAGLQAMKNGKFKLPIVQEVFLPGNNGDNQYKLLEKLGSGGFGDVYKAFDGSNVKEVAIKIFQNSVNLTDSNVFEAWKREAEQAINIHDTNVIETFEFRKGAFPDGSEKYYLVMELAEGGNLGGLINTHKSEEKYFSEPDLKIIFLDILCGLKAIHKVALHRDLKPENILIVNQVLKIADFGLAKYVDESTRTRTFKGAGTPKYMAPESWDRGQMSKATDIYSLGIVFYQLATFELPFSTADDYEMENLHRFGTIPSVKSINNMLSNRMEGVIKKMMQKSPNDRYLNTEAVIEDLQHPEPINSIEVGSLVDTAKAILDKEQKERNELLKKDSDAQKKRAVIKYKINELTEKTQLIIENINNQLPEEKLWLSKGSETDYMLIWGKRDLLRFRFNPELFDSSIKIDGLNVVASGSIEYALARQDEGMNLILVQSEGDEYGVWKVLDVNTSVLIPHVQYPRIADFKILKRISVLGNAMDAITHTLRDDVDNEISQMISQAFELIKSPRDRNEMVSDPLNFLDDIEEVGSNEDNW